MKVTLEFDDDGWAEEFMRLYDRRERLEANLRKSNALSLPFPFVLCRFGPMALAALWAILRVTGAHARPVVTTE